MDLFQEADTGTWESDEINLTVNVRPEKKKSFAEDRETEQFIMDASLNTQVGNKDFGTWFHQEVVYICT